MDARPVTLVVVAFLLLASVSFVVGATGTANDSPVQFENTITTGMTGVGVASAEAQGHVVPKAEVFYSQYHYDVGYYGVTSMVDALNREGHAKQFGRPLVIYVSDFTGSHANLTSSGAITLPSGRTPGWVRAERAYFVVGSQARTVGGPALVPFSDEGAARSFAQRYGGTVERWSAVQHRAFHTGTATTARLHEDVRNRSRWADRAVAATGRLLDRPVSVTVGVDAPTVQAAVHKASPNTTVRIPAGTYHVDNLTVDKPLTLRGAGNATHLQGNGNDTVVTAVAPRVAVASLRISGVGHHFQPTSKPKNNSEWDYHVRETYGYGNAGIVFAGSNGSLARNVTLSSPSNGIILRQSQGAAVTDSHLTGASDWQKGFMDVTAMLSRVVVQNSTFHGGRDAVYTHRADGLVVRNNVMRGPLRFGTHEMYTSDALVRNNTVRQASVGNVVMTRPSGNAIVCNDVRNSTIGVIVSGSASLIADNVLVNNKYGMHVSARRSVYENNVLMYNDIGARASSIIPTNRVVGNDFVGNGRYVAIQLGPLRIWSFHGRGNYWQGAPGTDRTGSGTLDSPFYPTDPVDSRLTNVSGTRTLESSPAVAVLRGFRSVMPGLRSKGVMDQHPLARPTHPEVVARIENETRYQR